MVSDKEIQRRLKISQTLKGRMPANLAQLHAMPFTEERKRKIGNANRGRRHTEESKRKISDAKRDPTRTALSPLYFEIRYCYKARIWRKAILKRDKNKCQLCGQKRLKLDIDHYPKRFIDIVREANIKTIEQALDCVGLWNINNGRALCRKCHSQTNTWGNKFQKNKVVTTVI